MILRLEERPVYSNRFFNVYDDIVKFPDGKQGTYLRVVEPGKGPGVAILPVCDGEVGLVSVYRYAVSRFQWEVPRGRGDDHEDPMVTAVNELTEELGEGPDALYSIGRVTPNSAILDSNIEMFYAWYSQKTTLTNDSNEVTAIQWVSFDDFEDMIKSGDISDSFTLSVYAAAHTHGLI